MWILCGGGCLVGEASRYPCDDTYENEKTGEEVIVFSTTERHFSMPEKVRSMDQIYKLSGVKKGPKIIKKSKKS
jgi:hypothetical protein